MGQNWSSISDLYLKKFEITPSTKVFTAGSCFAQHVGRCLKENGFAIIDTEPAPQTLKGADAHRYGFSLFSARFGNIYTMRQFVELIFESLNRLKREPIVWVKGEKFVDALRPNVEPEGLDTEEEVVLARKGHLGRIRLAIKRTQVMIFTLGLTEAWIHKRSGTVVPLVPGTSAGGVFDSHEYEFKNFTFTEILHDFLRLRSLMLRINPEMKFLLTVSPVPLAATATKEHVLTATTYSKSILRAVAGELAARFEDVDYFPSYELISSPFSREFLYEEDLREVRADALDAVMRSFLRAHAPNVRIKHQKNFSEHNTEVICEERLLDAFSWRRSA